VLLGARLLAAAPVPAVARLPVPSLTGSVPVPSLTGSGAVFSLSARLPVPSRLAQGGSRMLPLVLCANNAGVAPAGKVFRPEPIKLKPASEGVPHSLLLDTSDGDLTSPLD